MIRPDELQVGCWLFTTSSRDSDGLPEGGALLDQHTTSDGEIVYRCADITAGRPVTRTIPASQVDWTQSSLPNIRSLRSLARAMQRADLTDRKFTWTADLLLLSRIIGEHGPVKAGRR